MADTIAISVNVSLKDEITGKEIIEIFHAGSVPKNRISHIQILFSEIHPSSIIKFFEESNITFEEARKLHNALPVYFQDSRMEVLLNGNLGKAVASSG